MKSNRLLLSVAAAASALTLGLSANAQTTYYQPNAQQNFAVGEVPSNNLQTGPQLDGSRADAAKTVGYGQIEDQKPVVPARESWSTVQGYGAPNSPLQTGPQLDGSRADTARTAPQVDPHAPYRM